MNLIKLIDLNKVYPYDENHFEIGIKNISLSINSGEFVALQGPSGSGKTTLLNILGGIDVASSGIYLFKKKPISNYSAAALAQFRLHQVGLIFQSFHLIRNRNVIANVSLPLLYAGYSIEQANHRARYLLDRVGLSNYENKTVKNLSGGQQQRVAIARAMINQPPVILADEPTGNLDRNNSLIIYDLLKEINIRDHTTVILTTHDTSISQYAHRIINMRDGKLVE